MFMIQICCYVWQDFTVHQVSLCHLHGTWSYGFAILNMSLFLNDDDNNNNNNYKKKLTRQQVIQFLERIVDEKVS